MATLGYATVEIIPVFKGITEQLTRGVAVPAAAAGAKAGTGFGVEFAKTSSTSANAGISKLGSTAASKASVSGAEAGVAFGSKFGREATTTGTSGTSRLFGTLEGEAGAAGAMAGSKFGTSLKAKAMTQVKTLGVTLGGFFAASAAFDFFKGAITGASDLSESANKLDVTFGSASEKVKGFAATAATSLGQTELQARNAAATFGVFGKAAGLTGQELGGFATRMDTLSADLASFYNTSPEQAIEAIGAALRGEAEPIRSYGVLLDDATLRQEALREGLVSTTKDALTPQNKVLAAYNVILSQTGDAQGDFQRTSGGLANQQRILSAQWTDIQATVGQKLLPALTGLAQVANNDLIPGIAALGGVVGTMASAFGKLPGPVQAVAAAFIAMKIASSLGLFTSIASGFDTIRIKAMLAGDQIAGANKKMLLMKGGAAIAGTALLSMSGKADDAAQGLGTVANVAGAAAVGLSMGGPAGAAIGGGIAALTAYHSALGKVNDTLEATQKLADQDPFNFQAIVASAKSAQESLDNTNESASTWSSWADTASRYSGPLGGVFAVAGAGLDHVAGSAADASDEEKALVATTKEIRAGFQAFAGDLPKPLRAFDDIAKVLHKLGYSVKDIQGLMKNRNRSAPDAIAWQTALTAVKNYGIETGKIKKPLSDAAKAARDLAQATHDAWQNVLKMDNEALGKRGDWRNYLQSIQDTTDALKDKNHSLDQGTVKGREHNAIMDAEAQSALDFASNFKAGSKLQIEYLEKARQKLYEERQAFGDTKAEARRYVDQVLDIPEKWKTHLDFDTVEANRRLAAWRDSQSKLVDTTVHLDYIIRTTGKQPLGGHVVSTYTATGGPIVGGVPGRDSVPVMAMPGEHMLTTADVRAAGGQGAVYAIRRALHTGSLRGYAAGGPIGGVPGSGMSPGASGGASMASQVATLVKAVGRLERVVRVSTGKGGNTIGPVYVQPHDYRAFERQMDDRTRARSAAWT